MTRPRGAGLRLARLGSKLISGRSTARRPARTASLSSAAGISFPASPSALGEPSTISASIRSLCPIRLKSRISSFTQCDWEAGGEQMTMRKSDCRSAVSISPLRSGELDNSSRLRKMGERAALGLLPAPRS
jgi:hypothetical protein